MVPQGAQFLKNQMNLLIMSAQAIDHKISDLETSSRILRKSGNKKIMSFWMKLIIGNLVCIKTCYSFKPAKPFSMTKNTSSKIVTFWNHLDWWLKAYWPKIAHFSGILLIHIFPLDKNDTSNLEPKANPSKTILTLEMMIQLGKSSMAYVVTRSRQIVRVKKKEKNTTNGKLIVMSCT